MNFIKNLSTLEIIVIALVVFLLFGGKKLSEWARGLGETGKEIKKIKKDLTSAYEDLPDPLKRKEVG